MKKNMGNADKIIRSILAIVMIGLYYQGVIYGSLGVTLLILSAIFLLTSLISFCPLYTLFGIKTCKTS